MPKRADPTRLQKISHWLAWELTNTVTANSKETLRKEWEEARGETLDRLKMCLEAYGLLLSNGDVHRVDAIIAELEVVRGALRRSRWNYLDPVETGKGSRYLKRRAQENRTRIAEIEAKGSLTAADRKEIRKLRDEAEACDPSE